MQMGMGRNLSCQDTAFRAVGSCCPFQKGLTPVSRLAIYPALSSTVYAAVVSHRAVYIQTVVSGLVSEGRSHQKRGPPFLLSC